MYGGGSGNDIHNGTKITDENKFTTASGYLCGMAVTFQDASVAKDPLITQVAFFFLQQVMLVDIVGINVQIVQDNDQSGYSTYGQFSQSNVCQQPGQSSVCTNGVGVTIGDSAKITYSKAVTKGHTSMSSGGYQITAQASAGVKERMTYNFGASFSRTFNKQWTDSDTNTKVLTHTYATTSIVNLADTCVCPTNIQPGTMW